MNLFGKKKVKPSPNETIGRLRDTLEMLGKRESYLQKKSDVELVEAKKNANKNKRAALFALKKRRVYESQIEKLSGARMTIETQILHLEQATVTQEAMRAMQAGAVSMQEIHGHLTIDDVENTMEDIREQMDIANEITEAIAQPVGFGIDFDEDELNAELEELQQQQLDQSLLGVSEQQLPIVAPVTALPTVPSTLPQAPMHASQRQAIAMDPDEDEFRKLAAEMSA
eukprot:TRINITY_DN14_c0_g1_i1.p1 TRINITY_DN14_c0_g1~~TRINITY_DN14_c0_g1_i1.p1  ORF type:complete len:227 (+),score=57.16 TRINITY_DN14_c0_g1_i1:61-741(+)